MGINDFVTYNQAVKLKKIGFDWKCDHYYQRENNPTVIDAISDDSFKDISNFWKNFNSEDETFNRHNQLLNPYCSAPTLSQAAKWLREVKSFDIVVEPIYSHEQLCAYDWSIHGFDSIGYFHKIRDGKTDGLCCTYEHALSVGIDKVLEEIMKN